MGEIAQLLQAKVGLNEEQAQSAENAVLEYVRGKVPPQFQGMVDSFIGSQGAPAGQASGGSEPGGVGGLLGMAEGLLGERNG